MSVAESQESRMNIHSRRTIFSGLVIGIEEMEVEIGGCGCHSYQVVRHPGGAAVLPVHSDGTISLIRQLRPAIAAFSLEVPAGRLAPGEDPRDCARRELLEETGMNGGELVSLGWIHSSPGVFDEKIYLYAATGTSQGPPQPEADEEIEVIRLSFEEALAMAGDGRIGDAKTLAALLRWRLSDREGSSCA